MPADLVAIVAKAMAREPAERYPTAQELAEDLRRFQTGQLVGAHRYTAGQLVRRWRAATRRVALSTGSMARGITRGRRRLAVSASRGAAGGQPRRGAAGARRAATSWCSPRRAPPRTDPTSTVAWLKLYADGRVGRARASAAEALGRVSTRVMAGDTGGIRAMVFAPDGSALGAGSVDATVRVRRLATGRFAFWRVTIGSSTRCCFSLTDALSRGGVRFASGT